MTDTARLRELERQAQRLALSTSNVRVLGAAIGQLAADLDFDQPPDIEAIVDAALGERDGHPLLIEDALAAERARREARRLLDVEARGVWTPPETRTLADCLAQPAPSVTWRIHGWQPAQSRVMLAATRKSGKTTLVGSLVRSLVDGDAWLGRDAVVQVPGTVAILDTEMSARQLTAWLRAQGIRRPDRVIPVSLRGRVADLDLLDPARRDWWARWAQSYGVQYVVLDCLRPVLDALGLDESREAGRLLVAFDALLRDAGIPDGCVCHHMGHAGERARGDSRLRDWPDVEWRLMRQDDTDDASPRYLAAYGRDVEQPEMRLTHDPLTRRLTLAGGTRQDARTDAALDAVIAVLTSSNAALSVRAIQAALADSEHPRPAVRMAIKAGVRDGRLVAEAGPRRAILHRVGQCAGVGRQCAGHSSAQCASAYMDTRTGTHPVGTVEPTAPSAHSFPTTSGFDAFAFLDANGHPSRRAPS